jgi:hypothetical protein
VLVACATTQQHGKPMTKEVRCKTAALNQSRILGTQPSGDEAIKRCVANMTPEALDCFSAAKTKDDLDRCDSLQKEAPGSESP